MGWVGLGWMEETSGWCCLRLLDGGMVGCLDGGMIDRQALHGMVWSCKALHGVALNGIVDCLERYDGMGWDGSGIRTK